MKTKALSEVDGEIARSVAALTQLEQQRAKALGYEDAPVGDRLFARDRNKARLQAALASPVAAPQPAQLVKEKARLSALIAKRESPRALLVELQQREGFAAGEPQDMRRAAELKAREREIVDRGDLATVGIDALRQRLAALVPQERLHERQQGAAARTAWAETAGRYVDSARALRGVMDRLSQDCEDLRSAVRQGNAAAGDASVNENFELFDGEYVELELDETQRAVARRRLMRMGS